jgi:metal-sulfur cluster biosynthetic enzyme
MGQGDHDSDYAPVPRERLVFEQVHNRLAGIPDISKVSVDLLWEPKWTAHRISEVGRRQLRI